MLNRLSHPGAPLKRKYWQDPRVGHLEGSLVTSNHRTVPRITPTWVQSEDADPLKAGLPGLGKSPRETLRSRGARDLVHRYRLALQMN